MKAFTAITLIAFSLPALAQASYPSYPNDPQYEAQRRKYEDSLRQARRPAPTVTAPEIKIPVTEENATIAVTMGNDVPKAQSTTPVRKEGSLYVALSGGSGALTSPTSLQSSIFFGGAVDYGTSFYSSYAANGAVGYRFNNGFRVEGEYSYQQAGLSFLTLPGNAITYVDENGTRFKFSGQLGASGSVTSTSFMFNGYYDFPVANQLQFYIGAGVGIANVTASNVASPCPAVALETKTFTDNSSTTAAASLCGNQTTGAAVLVNSNSLVVAYQARAGIIYNFTDNLAFNLGARYFGTSRPTFTDTTGLTFATQGLSLPSAEAGVRFSF